MVNKVVISKSRMTVTMNGTEVRIPPQAFDLLYYLANNKNKVVTRDEIIAHAWVNKFVGNRTIDAHICTLRGKFGGIKHTPEGSFQTFIESPKKAGYKLIGDVKVDDDDNSKKQNDDLKSDDIIINGSYKSKTGNNSVVVLGIAKSKFGDLVIFAALGDMNALPINDFKTVYKPI